MRDALPCVDATDLLTRLVACLADTDPRSKALATQALYRDWLAGRLVFDPAAMPQALPPPGRPARPELVVFSAVPRRDPHMPGGRAALIHAIAHIEFNAINLALDAAYRFAGMPRDYYDDWLRVASEEAKHYLLLADHLATLGCAYGDFPAHNGLWEMAEKTAHDVLVRMALVPRVLEARGLDATPAITRKLRGVGDHAAVAILDVIEADEIGHVAVGNRWYRHACAARGLEPLATFQQLLIDYDAPPLKPPFNLDARRAGGFDAADIAWLATLK